MKQKPKTGTNRIRAEWVIVIPGVPRIFQGRFCRSLPSVAREGLIFDRCYTKIAGLLPAQVSLVTERQIN